MSDPSRPHAGFSLLEFVVVLVILGVLTVLASVRFQARDDYAVLVQADALARDLRHTQILATAWGTTLRFTGSPSGYHVSCVVAGAAPCDNDPVIDPGTGSAFNVSLTNSVTLGGAASVDFNYLGTPVSGAAIISANPAASFTLTQGAKTATVALRPLTGFPEVTY